MKKLVNISLVLLALSFAACKKNNTDTPPPAPIVVVPKVKTYTVSNGATLLNTVTFEYDNTGKKTKATYMDGSRYDYTYTANTVTEEYFTLAGVPQYKYIYTLNAGGLAESYSNPATPATIGYQFFNTEKHSILETTKTNGILTFQKYHLYDTDGNNSKDSVVQNSGLAALDLPRGHGDGVESRAAEAVDSSAWHRDW